MVSAERGNQPILLAAGSASAAAGSVRLPDMKPPRRIVRLVRSAAVAGVLGFGFVFATLRGTVEPIIGWSLAVPLYALAIVLPTILVRAVIRTSPTRHNGSGINDRPDRQTALANGYGGST